MVALLGLFTYSMFGLFSWVVWVLAGWDVLLLACLSGCHIGFFCVLIIFDDGLGGGGRPLIIG